MPFNLVIVAALAYGALLFTIAYVADRQKQRSWLGTPLIYTLSLSIYCTAWTFYGAVGYAARSGLEYLTIYLGPTLVMVGWWGLLRRLVRVGREQRITSIADLISSRYGKSESLGIVVTLLAIVGTTPYIALQLQSVTLSLAVFAEARGDGWGQMEMRAGALWVALGLIVFTVLFGTRNLDANERHHGVVTAIAVEAVVKLVALMAVGVFVVWGIGGGVSNVLGMIDASPLADHKQDGGRWVGLTVISAIAFLTLPRMFQVLVVENADERHLSTAGWAFPLYLLGMSLFVVPIAVVGMATLPAGANPDLFVLTVPLEYDRDGLAMLAFLGGFSSATSMVVVATIALATMVSNHIILPLWLPTTPVQMGTSGDIRRLLIRTRRLSIAGVLGLGYLYYRLSGGGVALASIGMISFTGVAQIGPALFAGLFWRGATRMGALTGVSVGFAVWAWCLFLPSVGEAGVLAPGVLENGPYGIGWLRPEAMFGVQGDPVLNAMMWSLLLNTLSFVAVSLLTTQNATERLQCVQFTSFVETPRSSQPGIAANGRTEDLLHMSQRILGEQEAQAFFQAEAEAQGGGNGLPDVTPVLIERLERLMAGSVGAATAHAMIWQVIDAGNISVEEMYAVADEAAEIMEYSSKLEQKSREQERTARALRQANEKLVAIGQQKDAFLSQISHELRTPMTSIRAFSDLLSESDITDDQRRRFTGIIRDETERLTRLLDDLLDLSVLENGRVTLNVQRVVLADLLDRAVAATGGVVGALTIARDRSAEQVMLQTDPDRLNQVFINLITNAAKYCDAPNPDLTIEVQIGHGMVAIDFIDNGSGIATAQQGLIFEKFSRLEEDGKAGGAGLGLAICREIMHRLGGQIDYLPGQRGGAFRVTLPVLR